MANLKTVRDARECSVGTRLQILTFNGLEYQAEVIADMGRECDLFVKWIPPRPTLHDTGVVCLYHVKFARIINDEGDND